MGLFSGLFKKTSEESRTSGYESNSEDLYSDDSQAETASLEDSRYRQYHAYNIDELFAEAGRVVIQHNKASIGILQRQFIIGFNRSARIMDQLCDAGVVGPELGTKPRRVLMNSDQFERFLELADLNFNSKEDDISEKLNQLRKINREKQERYLDNAIEETEKLIEEKMPDRKLSFTTNSVQAVLKTGNCIIDNCAYDDPIDFCESVLSRCSPYELRLILIDTDIRILEIFKDFPALYIPPVTDLEKVAVLLDWISKELQSRQKLQVESGYRDYSDFLRSLPEEKRKQPILIVIREAAGLLNNVEIHDQLQNILPVCSHFGISFVLFSQYRLPDLRIGGLKIFLSQKSAGWILSLFDNASSQQEVGAALEIDKMSGHLFEMFCADILEKNGFTNVRVTKQSGDMGGDVLAEKEQIRYVIQCKRYDSSVGLSAVQEVIGSRSVYNCHVGVVLTNNYYTKQAISLAEKTNVLLWDRNELMKMVDRANVKE